MQQQQHSTLHSFMCHSARCFAVCLHGGGAQIPTALLHRAVLPFSGTLQPPPDPHRQLIARKIAQKYEIYVKFAPRGLENKFRGKNKICSALLNEIVVWKSGCVSHCLYISGRMVQDGGSVWLLGYEGPAHVNRPTCNVQKPHPIFNFR